MSMGMKDLFDVTPYQPFISLINISGFSIIVISVQYKNWALLLFDLKLLYT